MLRHCARRTCPTFFLIVLSACLSSVPADADEKATEQGASQKPGAPQPPVKEEEDPFAGVTVQPKPEEKPKESGRSWRESFFKDNFGFRKEIMSQFNTNQLDFAGR